MAKNFKGKAQKPPLSVVDKVIYYGVILLLIFIGAFGWVIFGLKIAQQIAFNDLSVVAGSARIGPLCAAPLCLLSFALALLVYLFGMKARQPIVGNKSYKTPAFSNIIKVYPLFSQDFRCHLELKSRHQLKKAIILLSAILLVCLLILPLGFYSRRVLTDEHQLLTYDSLNRVSDSHDIHEAERILININTIYARHTPFLYKLQLQFVFEDTTYFFYIADFHQMSRADALRYMIGLKEFLGPSKYEIHNAGLIDHLIFDRLYTDAEAKLLYQLFDATP